MDMRRNIPLFIAFRVLFNARFYYPVIGVLFLDLGLTLAQYSLLNVAWAVAILTLEIPSGALADLIGRKRMVVLAAALMVVEMLLFVFAPTGNPTLLFAMLLLNRILSGAAEASASGADEALAYDSLPEAGRDATWPRVLERLMRWQSGGFFVAMVIGALAYDSAALSAVAHFLGIDWTPREGETVRWPVDLTLIMAFVCVGVALGLREPTAAHRAAAPSIRSAWGNVRVGAHTVFTDRRILLVLLAALTCDSIVRLFLTVESNYLRLIEIPEYLFGVIGSSMALVGFVAAPLSRRLVADCSVATNFAFSAVLIVVGLIGAVFAAPWWGVWVIFPLGLSMNALSFFVSHYLNTWTRPEVRATVLSFRGVALNLAYGSVGLLFAGLSARLRDSNPDASGNMIFASALPWLPGGFLVAIAIVGLFAAVSREKCRQEQSP